MTTITPSDAELAVSIAEGDTVALGELYDRYADRIHTMCVHLLGDEHEAADVTAEVFLTAAERLGQLRDPERVRPWLYAVARHEVYRRTRQRRRVRSTDELGDAAVDLTGAGDAVGDPSGPEDTDAGDPRTDEERRAERAAVLVDAAAGLDDRDRLVMELHLVQGLGGDDLADALGVRTATAYQRVHRMKERLERSVAALLVARTARDLCAGLHTVTTAWDGTWSVLWRKRVARHMDRCARCGAVRRDLPGSVVGGHALADAARAAVLAAPVAARRRVMDEAPGRAPVTARGGWRRDGFPPAEPGRSRGAAVLAAVVVLAGLAGVALPGTAPLPGADEPVEVVAQEVPAAPVPTAVPRAEPVPVDGAAVGRPPTTATSVAPAATPSTTTAPATPPAATDPAPAPTPVPAPAPAPPPTPSPTTAPPPDTTAPTVVLGGPACTPHGGTATFTATVTDDGTVATVTLTWNGSVSGTAPMSGGGPTWTGSLAVPYPPPFVTHLDVVATATDAAGNSASSGVVAMTSGPVCS